MQEDYQKNKIPSTEKSIEPGTRIMRSPHDRTNPYVVINKNLLTDESLSPQCRFLLTFLLSKPADWNIQVDQLVTKWLSKKAIYKIFHEAIEAGYLKREDIKKRGLKNGCIYYLAETPIYKNDCQIIQQHAEPQQTVNGNHLYILSNDKELNNQRHRGGSPGEQSVASLPPTPPSRPSVLKKELLSDGTFQLSKRMAKGNPPTPGKPEMVYETKEILDGIFTLGLHKLRINEEDKIWFHGFSPRVIIDSADRINVMSKKKKKIRNYTALLFAECCKEIKARNWH